ncbi:3-oxoadipyl-CoA thiolase [Paracoccus saliphilus]|uniref:3-oxoadipyl-CoA thiolase n=1 Tax=Paracoccus saliphilus TaxID=405559 RepID=A0AA45W665_9RHOB|nr:3-oxoadipyl-CoA thiolase [Paracoccus saliphilus]
MNHVYICDYIRTPIGRYGGSLSSVRADDLAALPLSALKDRLPELDWEAVVDVIYGCANQAGEDNRSVARMALLLAGLPETVSGTTINRLCGSGMDAVLAAYRRLALSEGDLAIAGGVESMSRAPFVMAKAGSAFSRSAKIEDTTIGWRFVNREMHRLYGTESMPDTAENVAEDFGISREDQDAFALRSQTRAVAAITSGVLAEEIAPVSLPQRKGPPVIFDTDEHPRATTAEKLAALRAPFRDGGSVTAGNASGVNDGAAALVLATEDGIARHGHWPGPRDRKAVRASGPCAVGIRPDRTERGLRQPGPGGATAAWSAGRRRPCEPERRRHRPGPPLGHVGRPDRRHGGTGAGPRRGAAGAGHDVHRCRSGHCLVS